MGQIRGKKAHIDACNLRVLSSFGIPYAGMHILVSTDNSAMADGNGNFDAYVVGDGHTAATELELKSIADMTPREDSLNSVSSGALFELYGKMGLTGDGGTADVVLSNYVSITSGGAFISSSSPYKWNATASTGTVGKLIDVSAYKGLPIKIQRKEGVNFRYAFLKSNTYAVNTVPDYCTGSPFIINDTNYLIENTIPVDCNWLYVSVSLGGTDSTPISITVENPTSGILNPSDVLETEDKTSFAAAINELNSKISGESGADDVILNVDSTAQGFISSSSAKWSSPLASNTSVFYDLSAYKGMPISIKRNATGLYRYAFLKSTYYASGATPDYCNGCSIVVIDSNDARLEFNDVIPSDCNYLYATTIISNVNVAAEIVVTNVTGEAISLPIKLVAGKLDANGVIVGSTMSDSDIFLNMITPLYLNAKIVNFPLDNDESATYYFYDKGFAFIASSSNAENIPSLAKYMKVMVSKATEYSSLEKVVVATLTRNGGEIFVKNGNAGQTIFFSYGVNIPTTLYPSGDTYSGVQKAYNNGYVVLPPNYTKEGEPVKLAIFAHGTGGYEFNETAVKTYNKFVQFIAKNGYAVVDCSAMTNLYSGTTKTDGTTNSSVVDTNFPCPISINNFVELYNVVTRDYNISKESVFIYGKSSGGRMATILGQLKDIPIKAVGVLAGSVDSLIDTRSLDSSIAGANWGLANLGYPSPNISRKAASSADVAYLVANYEKLIGFNSIWMNTTGIDFETWTSAVFQSSHTSASYLANTTLTDMIANASKAINVPVKFWHAEDDVNVPLAGTLFFAQLVRNGGGRCIVETIPSGLGAHWAVDTDANAPQVSYTTKFGETISVTCAYAELVDWFDQWG